MHMRIHTCTQKVAPVEEVCGWGWAGGRREEEVVKVSEGPVVTNLRVWVREREKETEREREETKGAGKRKAVEEVERESQGEELKRNERRWRRLSERARGKICTVSSRGVACRGAG